MNGGEALVATLAAHGVETAFCVPGESYLAVLEGLRRHANRIRLVPTRHEAGAAFAANAYAKIGRRPGVAFVSRGPGATNASIGVHTADQDSIPLVLFIGHVPRAEKGREAFQEIDYHRMYGGIAKAVLEPESAAEVAAVTARALALAEAGRPGPVVVVLPEDVTEAEAGEAAIPARHPRPVAAAGDAALEAARALIDDAERPLLIAGEMVKFEGCQRELAGFAEAIGCPVVAAFRCQDVINNDHEAYTGLFGLGRPPYLKQAWAEADLAIVAGSRLDAITTEDFALMAGDKPILHIHPDADVIARAGATLGLAADSGPVLEALGRLAAPPEPDRLAWRDGLRQGYLTFVTDKAEALGPVDMTEVVRVVDDVLQHHDHVVTNDAGNFSTWLHRFFRYRIPNCQAGPMSGAMGYAVPAAVGAQLARPSARVVAFVGDGGFMMTGAEFATACQEGLPVVVIVCDNQAYGTIMAHQHRYAGAGNYSAVSMKGPDFAALGAAYGAQSWTVETTAAFRPAFEAALAAEAPALIHVKTDLRDISAAGPLRD